MQIKILSEAPVRVGVVGCGVVADYGHIPAIHRLEEARLVGFADPSEERRRAQADKYGLPCFESFEQMLGAIEMDAVSIPTQPDIKLDMIRLATANGLHAFCEKPLSDSVEDAEEIVRLSDEAGLFVGMAFVYRGQLVVQRMMELLHEGAIGKLRVVRTMNLWDYHGLRDEIDRPGRRRRALRNLGTLDCGVHHYDLVRYMSGGNFAEVHSVGTIIDAENTLPDHIMTNAVMDNGVIVSLEESAVWGYTAAERPRYLHAYTLLGENGLMRASAGGVAHGNSELYIVSGEKQWTEELSSDKAWDETYRQFFQTILGRDVPNRFVADAHDALANMKVAREVIAQCR
jgi:predicted dehydrogenase